MMRAMILLLLGSVLLVLVGCRAESVVGSWTSKDGTTKVEFQQDGSVAGSATIGPIPVEFRARYRYDRNGLTLTDIDVPVLKLAPTGAQDLARQAIPAVIDHQVRWVDDQTIQISGGTFLNGEFKRKD